MTNLTRRTLMKGIAATGLAGALGSRAAFAADEPLGITLVIPSPVGDVGWGRALAAGLEPVKAAYGDKVKVTVIENIAEGPDADRIMNKTVADGNKFLIAGSFGYQNGALQIARRDPSVTVLHASGFQVAPNFSPFAAK
ncbi:MAG: twin-arginine translocation signal domain-containing protein, partial [Ensifer alkalisoli]|nr:twin-arginine translocation signal domain-containing protein [Sinorhizobium alkalisoli]